MKGQLEISFQWIYVVIAGGAFLLIFFLVFKGCVEAGEQQAQVSNVRTAANAIGTQSWQEGARNITLNADVSCVGGVLTLRSNDAASQLEQVPAFLSPLLHGQSLLITEEVNLEQYGTPSIRLGNVLYGIDRNTRYYIVRDAGNRHERLAEHVAAPNIKTVDSFASITDVPSTTNGVVIVAWSAPPPTLQVPDVPVYVLWVRSDTEIEFRTYDGGYTIAGTSSYGGDYMLAGAMVSGRKSSYDCSKQNFYKRTRDVLDVYARRNQAILPQVPESCRQQLQQADPLLRGDIEALFSSNIMRIQAALNSMSCPVVA
jgi:hypothetical protein